jgi:hypothetical protein
MLSTDSTSNRIARMDEAAQDAMMTEDPLSVELMDWNGPSPEDLDEAVKKNVAKSREEAEKRTGHRRHIVRQSKKLIEGFRAFSYDGGTESLFLYPKLTQIGVGPDGIERIATALSIGKERIKQRNIARREYGSARAAVSRRKQRRPTNRFLEIGFRRHTTKADYDATDLPP